MSGIPLEEIEKYHEKKNFRIMNWLITHEDHLHLHKVSGLISIVHFVICYCRFILSACKTFGINNDWMSFALMTNHGLLAVLALQFPVEKFRITGTQNMTTEQVYHTIIFTFRSVLIYFLSHLIPRIYIVIVHHILADVITYIYHEYENGTTIRGGVADKWAPA